MPRRKLYYGYIRNANARKLSFKKRKQHILKKVQELTILCGIEACGIVYSPDEPEPTFWPSQGEVERMLLHYESIPDFEKCSKKINQEGYIKESVKKMEKQLKTVESTNRDLENDQFMHQIHRAGRKFEEFTKEELIGLKGYVEEKKRVLEKRMLHHQGSISEPILYYEEPETRIEDDEPLLNQWFVDMMNNETQYEGSSSNGCVLEKQTLQENCENAVEYNGMSQGNGINQDYSSKFEISLGQNGEIVASSYSMEICNEISYGINNGGNHEGINNQVIEDVYGSNAPIFEQEGIINNGNLEGINNQVVGGADDNINAAMFLHGNNQISVGQGEIGASSYHDMEIYNGNPDELGINHEVNEEAGNNEFGVFPNENTQGSATLYGWNWSPPNVGDFNVQGFQHDTLDFPNNTNMFGATLLSSNSMDVDQPNYVSYAPDYVSVGGNGGENMAQQPGNYYIN